MPPSGPSTPIPTGPASLRKAPPSGPRAQSNQQAPPTGPAASRPTPVAIPFGSSKYRRAGGSGPGPGPGSYHQHAYGRSPSQFDGVPTGPQAESSRYATSGGPHAESSRQALSHNPPSRTGRTTATKTTPRSTKSDHQPRQRSITPPSGPRSSREPIDDEDARFKSKLLPNTTQTTTARTPISIAFPSLKVNGTAKPKSPNLPPPPPSDRPPTPPIGGESPTKPPVATPPPPPDDDEGLAEPPPPPSPPAESTPPPPPPQADHASGLRPPTPPVPEFEPIKIALPTRPGSSVAKEVPPAFHFRSIPVRRRSPTPEEDEDSETDKDARSPRRRPLSPPVPPRELTPPPPPRELTPPPPPREPTPPPYEPPPYIPPPSTSHRPGLGNFRILHDPSVDDPKKGGKEVKKRTDGQGIDKVVDPRLTMPLDVRTRGRGPAKQRSEFYEVAYEVSSIQVQQSPGRVADMCRSGTRIPSGVNLSRPPVPS